MCNIENMKYLAGIIEHVPLPLQVRYVFSCAPINRNRPFVCAIFLKVKIFCFFLSNDLLFNL